MTWSHGSERTDSEASGSTGLTRRFLLSLALFCFASFQLTGTPSLQAALASVWLVLQACLGTVFLRFVIPSTRVSTTLAAGPGLLIGGALSVLVFNLFGRGELGAFGVGLLNLLALIHLMRTPRIQSSHGATLRTYLLLGGLVSTAMSSEYSWFTVAGAGFLVSYMAFSISRARTLINFVAPIVALAGVLASTGLRGSWWWVVSDDYQFLEVLSKSLTKSGPIADWGVLNFGTYHWLPYAWSGLIDYLSMSSEPYITNLRVMPVLFSICLCSSLLGIASSLVRSANRYIFATYITWAVVATMRLDWSGLGTAGIYAVLSGFLLVLISQAFAESQLWRRLGLYGLFAVVLVLTKFGAAFTFLPIVVAREMSIHSVKGPRFSSSLKLALATTVAGIISLSLISPMSHIVGSFTIGVPNPNLGEIGRHGVIAAVLGLFLLQPWLFQIVIFVWILLAKSGSSALESSQRFLLSMSVLPFVGLCYDLVVVGNPNQMAHMQFSGPNYFVGLLALLVAIEFYRGDSPTRISSFPSNTLWIAVGFGSLAWRTVIEATQLSYKIELATIRAVVSDGRVLFLAVLTLALVFGDSASRQTYVSIRVAMVVLILGGMTSSLTLQPLSIEKLSTKRGDLNFYLGPPDSEKVGRFLKAVTPIDAKVATNFLFAKGPDESESDFSLSVWSEREFLVLGPRFARVLSEPSDVDAAVSLCLGFADLPNQKILEKLKSMNISWFVVDLMATSNRNWQPFASVVYQTDRFWVLRLRDQ